MKKFWWGLALGLALLSTAFRPRLFQGGCDSPAHLLLSESFDKNQSAIGSHALRLELSEELSRQGFSISDISRAISPICVHWDGSHEYNQYPPYLAAFLRLLPLKLRAVGFGVLVFVLFLLAALIFAALTQNENRGDFVLAMMLLLVLPIFYPELRSVFGLPITFPILFLIPALLLKNKNPAWIGALLGLASGVRYDVALPAILIGVFGLFHSRHKGRWVFGFGLAYALTALLPLGIYQNYVLGNWHRPVTPQYDLAFVDSPADFAKNLGKYFISGWTMWGLAALGFRFTPKNFAERRLKTFLGFVAIFALLFIAAKKIQMSYYFWPWAAFGYALFLLEVGRRGFWPKYRPVALAGLIAFGGVQSVKGAMRVAVDFKLYSQWQKNLPRSFPAGSAWVDAEIWSANVETYRIHNGLSLEPIVRNGAEVPPALSQVINQFLDRKKIPIYGLKNFEGELGCTRNCPP